jgi:hypothetical protein
MMLETPRMACKQGNRYSFCTAEWQLWVKTSKTRGKHMTSGLPPVADIRLGARGHLAACDIEKGCRPFVRDSKLSLSKEAELRVPSPGEPKGNLNALKHGRDAAEAILHPRKVCAAAVPPIAAISAGRPWGGVSQLFRLRVGKPKIARPQISNRGPRPITVTS